MQDQKAEGQQEHQLAAGEATTSTPPSTPSLERKHDYAYYKSVFGSHPMPFAFLDLDLLQQNIRQIVAQAQGKKVRLASKSLRSIPVIRRIIAADPCFQGIMCYTAQEAVYLASQGFEDLLIGYPAWNEQDIAVVARATAAGTHITLMVDSTEHVEQIELVASRYGVRLPLCLEIDMSMDLPGLHFGVWRSPVRTPGQARLVLERIMASPHVWLDGLMGYEAQIAGVGDNFPGHKFKNAVVQRLKQRSIREIAVRRSAIVELVKSYGVSLRFVNGGGTGSIVTTRTEQAVTEITVGSGFYAPALFDNYRDFRYHPAAAFAIEIVRHPRPHIYTCLGGGYIASGSVGSEKQPQPYLPRWTAWLHPVRQTPVGSIVGLCIFGLVVGLLLGFIMTPIGAFGFLGTLDALFVLIIYALVCIASIRFFWRKRRAQFNIFRHGVVPVLGTLLILTIFVFLVIAPAPPPLNLIPFILAVWVLLGVGLLFVLRRKLAQ